MLQSLRSEYAGSQFLRFLVVGGVSTAVQYVTLWLLVEVGVGVVLASALGFTLGAVVSYMVNYLYTFKSDQKHREAAFRFIVVASMGLLFNTGLMTLFLIILPVHYFISQALATVLVLFWNFSANRRWTFRA